MTTEVQWWTDLSCIRKHRFDKLDVWLCFKINRNPCVWVATGCMWWFVFASERCLNLSWRSKPNEVSSMLHNISFVRKVHTWTAKEKLLLCLHMKNVVKTTLTYWYRISLIFKAFSRYLWKLSSFQSESLNTCYKTSECLLCNLSTMNWGRNMFCVMNVSRMKGLRGCDCLQWQGLHTHVDQDMPSWTLCHLSVFLFQFFPKGCYQPVQTPFLPVQDSHAYYCSHSLSKSQWLWQFHHR